MNDHRAFVTPEEKRECLKQYRLEYKDKIAEQNKQYRREHKDKIAEQKSERNKIKMTCDCGCVITKINLTRHKRSKNHQDLMKSIEQ